MSYNTFSPIVTDGLVLYLDAANTKSYPGTGTNWYDLTKNSNNGVLTSGPVFNNENGGNITFDGVDDRVSGNSINTGQNFTVSAWIYPTLLGSIRRCVVSNSYPNTGQLGWLFCTAGFNNPDNFFLSIGADLAYKVSLNGSLSLNTWAYISAVVKNGGEFIDLYKNGEILGWSYSNLTPISIDYSNSQFHIGFRYLSQTDPFTGGISQVKIYNRALSSTEMLQNYNATKNRFI